MFHISADEKVNKSLRYSLWDGAFASVMFSIYENYIAPFAIFLQATAPQLALLSSLPNLLGNLLQVKSPAVAEKTGSRLKVVTFFVFLQAMMWAAVIVTPFMATGAAVSLLIVFVIALSSFGLFGTSAWSSMMSDLVPAPIRGTYFSWRNRTLGLVGLGGGFVSGIILYMFRHRPLAGFVTIFSAAMCCRFCSWYFLTKMYEPPLSIKAEHYFSFWMFIRRWRQSNFVKFAFFVAGINFGTYIASPFFSFYMLKNLGLDYFSYTVVVVTAPLVMLLMMKAWGRQSDIVGNIKVLKLTSLFIPLIPLTWLFSQQVWYLLCIQVLAGFFWSGFNLCAINFMYDAVSPEKRTRAISYFNLINGFGIFAGAVLGGYLFKIVPELFGYKALRVFLISGLVRALVAFVFIPRLKEVRPVKQVRAGALFYNVLLGAKD